MIEAEILLRRGHAAEESGDFALARQLFEHGAAIDDATCLWRLAYMYDVGLGLNTDKKYALKLYIRAWQGGAETGKNIAILYREIGNSRGMVRWFQKSVDRRDDGACVDLAKLYLSGTGVPVSVGKARRLLLRAVEGQNISEADIETAQEMLEELRPKSVLADGS